jgi:hypothetical protein
METEKTETKELKQCSRCHSLLLLIYFALNRKGEYFKLCNNCRKKFRDVNDNRLGYLTNYYETNKSSILERNKKWNDANKESIREYSREKRKCECGSSFRRDGKAEHINTIKHKKYIDGLS